MLKFVPKFIKKSLPKYFDNCFQSASLTHHYSTIVAVDHNLTILKFDKISSQQLIRHIGAVLQDEQPEKTKKQRRYLRDRKTTPIGYIYVTVKQDRLAIFS